jgi:hypothetical protein
MENRSLEGGEARVSSSGWRAEMWRRRWRNEGMEKGEGEVSVTLRRENCRVESRSCYFEEVVREAAELLAGCAVGDEWLASDSCWRVTNYPA